MESGYSLKEYKPLLIIFLIIILLTLSKQAFANIWSIKSLMNDFMGIFFIIFGLFKIINLKDFAHAYAEYDILAKKSKVYALAYPFIELTLGIFYLTGWAPIMTSIITLALMSISSVGVAQELRKGRHIMCACLGTVFNIPMTYVTLGEDLLMAAMAFIMLMMQLF